MKPITAAERFGMDPQNAHIMDQLFQAETAVESLIKRGFAVIHVVIGGHAPVIWIQNCARCAQLQGALTVARCGPYGPERIMVAIVERCQVKWTVRGH